MAKTSLGKTRSESDPYLTVVNKRTGFTYKVLKAYSADPNKKYARWFLATTSPYTFGSSELGDGYIADVDGDIVHRDPAVTDADLPAHLLNGTRAPGSDDLFGF